MNENNSATTAVFERFLEHDQISKLRPVEMKKILGGAGSVPNLRYCQPA